ncbi:MAG: hypothetical protein K5894_05850 [Lachnospiraceae bacterium]|nr:hypothetical protein [Lachnospiraceae bacterium]
MTKKNIGWILVIIGLFMLFKMVRVSSFGFFSIGGISTSSIIFVLIILSAIGVVVKGSKFTYGCLVGSFGLMVLSLILGMRLHFACSSFTDILLVFVPIVVGIGLVIKSALEKMKD